MEQETKTVQLNVVDGLAFAEFKAKMEGFARGVQVGITAAIQARTEQLAQAAQTGQNLQSNKPAVDVERGVDHSDARDEQGLREPADSRAEHASNGRAVGDV